MHNFSTLEFSNGSYLWEQALLPENHLRLNLRKFRPEPTRSDENPSKSVLFSLNVLHKFLQQFSSTSKNQQSPYKDVFYLFLKENPSNLLSKIPNHSSLTPLPTHHQKHLRDFLSHKLYLRPCPCRLCHPKRNENLRTHNRIQRQHRRP